MRKIRTFSAVLSLFLLVPASITWAQTVSSQKGLTTAVFTTPQGNIKVYLPDDIRPGDVISGTVVAEPNGKNARQTENNHAELKKYSIGFNGEKFPVDKADKLFQFQVQSGKSVSGIMELINISGFKIAELTIPTISEKYQQPASGECVTPSHALTGSPMKVTGSFDGNAANTNVSLNGQACEMIAESFRQCFVFYPENAKGIQTLNVQENNQPKCSQQISGVQMNVSAGKLDLRKGEKTFIDVNITGLQNLPDTALLALTNITTGVVTMMPSNTIVIPLLPDSVGQGTFNKRFDIQSTRTGTFSINVNLDLPEVQAIWPPTQPQPGDNPPPKDTTQPQPPHGDSTVAQCPGCKCSCTATIIFDGKEGDIWNYSVVVKSTCTGSSGAPPCTPCSVIEPAKKFWTISYSHVDPIEVIGGHTDASFKFKNPTGAAFTLYVKATVTCSDKSQCSCEDKIIFVPSTPTPEKGSCECDGSCSIIKTKSTSTHLEFDAFVRAECKGFSGTGTTRVMCEVMDIDYKWHMADNSVLDIDGDANKKKVKLKIKKPGPYSLNLTVTITCNDGSECIRNCNYEGNILPPWPNPATCLMAVDEFDTPKMTGRLKPAFVIKEETKIKRDGFIPLGAEGNDDDQLTWECIPETKCGPGGSKTILLNGRVRFKWVIIKGDGSFVKLGCLPDNEWDASGDYVIFKPPVIPLPVTMDDTIATTVIQLKIIDDNPTQPQDETVIKEVTVTTKRSTVPTDGTDPTKADYYRVTVTSDTKEDKKTKTEPEPSKDAKCKPDGPVWSKLPPLGATAIDLPEDMKGKIVPDRETILLGQWIVLKAKDVRDIDKAQKIVCKSTNCIDPPPFEKDYEDDVAFIWSRDKTIGRGLFANDLITDTGSTVIYKTPDKWPEEIKADFFDIEITLYATNPKSGERKDPDGGKSTKKLRVYRPGVKLSLVPLTWLPTDKGEVELTSTLMMKDGTWKAAPAHACRIHFFELMDVSNEKGVCMNDPLPDKAKLCRDLKITKQKGQEPFLDTSILTDCKGKEYFMQARTEAPVHSHTIKIYSEDFGAYGFLRSFANINKGGNNNNKEDQQPYYEPIPITPLEVLHPSRGKFEFDNKDNRVSIPRDADNNHIADGGWITFDSKPVADPPFNYEDNDGKPAGADVGDGLSNYEEYRGFMYQVTGEEKTTTEVFPVMKALHVRTNHEVKTIFIRNEHSLPIKLYKDITGLEVLEISNLQYQTDKIRVVNFNAPPVSKNRRSPTTHLVDQKGLYLYDGKMNEKLLGIAVKGPARPNDVESIIVYKEKVQAEVDRINAIVDEYNKDPAKLKKFKGGFKHLSFPDKLAAVVAHELLHGNNVCHHGEGDESLDVSHDKMNGLRSGDISCVMRYDNTGTKIKDTTYFPELPGTALCTSSEGKVYNAPVSFIDKNRNEKVADRGYGNSSPGRGNCASQIRISGVGEKPPVCPKPK